MAKIKQKIKNKIRIDCVCAIYFPINKLKNTFKYLANLL